MRFRLIGLGRVIEAKQAVDLLTPLVHAPR
jgi:hypothetical protein